MLGLAAKYDYTPRMYRRIVFAAAQGVSFQDAAEALAELGELKLLPQRIWRAAKRIGFAASAVIYTTFAFTAISLARSTTAAPNGNTKVTSLTQRVMIHASRRVVIGVVGVWVDGSGGLDRVALEHDEIVSTVRIRGERATRFDMVGSTTAASALVPEIRDARE